MFLILTANASQQANNPSETWQDFWNRFKFLDTAFCAYAS